MLPLAVSSKKTIACSPYIHQLDKEAVSRRTGGHLAELEQAGGGSRTMSISCSTILSLLKTSHC